MASPQKNAAAADVDALSFEAAVEELEKIVSKLEGGNAKLDDAIGDYERGSALKKRAEVLLEQAEMRVQKIVANKNGIQGTETLD